MVGLDEKSPFVLFLEKTCKKSTQHAFTYFIISFIEAVLLTITHRFCQFPCHWANVYGEKESLNILLLKRTICSLEICLNLAKIMFFTCWNKKIGYRDGSVIEARYRQCFEPCTGANSAV